MSGGAITAWAVIGIVGGWLTHPVLEAWRGIAPVITWAQPMLLLLIAATLGVTAWVTHRQLQVRGERIEAHQAVNRLVLARACALVGALLAGGYLGYAISWLGYDMSTTAGDRLVRSAVAAVAGATIVIAARLLEHACRVRKPDEN
jgi:MFS family permease